jgi:hypothetical protein
MKSCPKCNRTYPDEGQKFCTFDGGLLIAPQTFDPNATIRATSIDLNAPSERPTSRDLPDPNATIIENYPATVALPRNTGPTTGPTGTPNTSDIARPPAAPPPAPPPPPPVAATPPPAPPPPPVEQPHVTAEVPVVQPPPVVQTPAPSAPLPAPAAKKKSKVPLIIGVLVVLLLLGGGALAGLFFFVVKPRLDQMAAERNPQPAPSVTISTPTPVPSVEAPSPTPEETFVPPPGTVQFVNSNEKLDGKLAEHYLDFSFYYPKAWTRDPKAGVAGASNFVKVDRVLPPDFTQENFAVGWYTSTGTFVGDLPSFPERAAEFSKSLAKNIPDYKQVSEGPTKVNSMDAYEFRWEGLSKGTERGDLNLWGRVIFLPTGKEGDTTGATLIMLCTNLAGELSSVEDVGVKGEAPVILDSFRFGKKK